MALLAFLERLRIHALSEDFEAAQQQLENFRNSIFTLGDEKQFNVKCCIHFEDNDKPRNCQIPVEKLMTFGQLKLKLKQTFSTLLDYTLTVIVGRRVPLDIYTLQMLNVTSNRATLYILATRPVHQVGGERAGWSSSSNGLSVNSQYKVNKEMFVPQKDIQDYFTMLEQIEGLLSQKKVFEVLKVVDAVKDNVENDRSPASAPPLIHRLIVHVESIQARHGSIVIPRVLWSTTVAKLKTELEDRFCIPKKLQRWFVVNEIRRDDFRLEQAASSNDSLSEFEVNLYLVTPESAKITAANIQSMYEGLKQKQVGIGHGNPMAKSLQPSLADESEEEEEVDDENWTSLGSNLSGGTPRQPHCANVVPDFDRGRLGDGKEVGGVKAKKKVSFIPNAVTRAQMNQVRWCCDVCSIVNNRPYFLICETCGVGGRPDNFIVPDWYEPDEEERRKLEVDRRNEELTRRLLNEDEHAGDANQPRRPAARVATERVLVSWTCDLCSFAQNRPHFKICEVCFTGTRPEAFVIPDWYEPDADEKAKLETEKNNEQLTMQLLKAEEEKAKKEAENRYRELLWAEDSRGYFGNRDVFDCPVCADEVGVGEGVTLRQCHHSICKDCLTGHLSACEDGVNAKCPFVDEGNNACEQPILQQEMRAILSPEVFEKLQRNAFAQAEAAEPNSFHCKTTDCPGWCIVEDEVNFFKCPICSKVNCLTCAAIHEPMNCKEYQDDLKAKATNDAAAQATEQMLRQLVQNGEAINCPGCQVIVQKKSGCDWMQCSMCKTEICWATRGPRWGPKGRGDTSGGCKCRSPNICHPKCGNCH